MSTDDLDTPHSTEAAEPISEDRIEIVTRSEFKMVVAMLDEHGRRLDACETDRKDHRTTTGQHSKVIVDLQAQDERFLEMKKQRDEEIQEMRNEFASINTQLVEGNELKKSSNEIKAKTLEEAVGLRSDFNDAARKFTTAILKELGKPKFLVAVTLGGMLFGFLVALSQALVAWFSK